MGFNKPVLTGRLQQYVSVVLSEFYLGLQVKQEAVECSLYFAIK